MEKLPEKWCIKVTDENASILSKWRTAGHDVSDGWLYDSDGTWFPNKPSFYTEITFDQFKRLVLGETEEWVPKVGDWVTCIAHNPWPTLKKNTTVITKVTDNEIYTEDNNATGSSWCNKKRFKESYRPARPEEIPQEEVEYWEMIENSGWNKESAIIGKIYPAGINPPFSMHSWELVLGSFRHYFKPSTREAYEAQQKAVVNIIMDGKVVGRMKEIKQELNKCSTINTNQNEYKNENKSIKVRGSSISISTVSRARGKSLCSSGGKISLGTYYSRNKQKPCNSKA